MLDAGEPLTADWIKAGTWTVDVAGTAYDAVVSLRPMYDPTQRTDQGLTPSRRQIADASRQSPSLGDQLHRQGS